jgi:hypothetical protein
VWPLVDSSSSSSGPRPPAGREGEGG